MNHLDLFSGIGGFTLAAQQVWGDEHNIICFVEIDKFCQKVLKKHWPNVPIHDDIRTLDYETIMAYAEWKRRQIAITTSRSNECNNGQAITKNKIGEEAVIDLITGGFPCQPYSCAGKQRGAADDRALWPSMYRVIRECQPRWVIGENVAGIIRMELDNCIADLEDAGYTTESFIIPACAVDAPHRRDRVWIVAYRTERNEPRTLQKQNRKSEISAIGTQIGGYCDDSRIVADTNRKGLQKRQGEKQAAIQRIDTIDRTKGTKWLPEPCLGDLADGLPPELVEPLRPGDGWGIMPVPRVATGITNRVQKLKALGNAILPQCVIPIMQAIKDISQT